MIWSPIGQIIDLLKCSLCSIIFFCREDFNADETELAQADVDAREAQGNFPSEEELQMIADLPPRLQDGKLTAEFNFQKLQEKWQKRRRKDSPNLDKDAAQRLAQSALQVDMLHSVFCHFPVTFNTNLLEEGILRCNPVSYCLQNLSFPFGLSMSPML